MLFFQQLVLNILEKINETVKASMQPLNDIVTYLYLQGTSRYAAEISVLQCSEEIK